MHTLGWQIKTNSRSNSLEYRQNETYLEAIYPHMTPLLMFKLFTIKSPYYIQTPPYSMASLNPYKKSFYGRKIKHVLAKTECTKYLEFI